jgi:putative phosphoribosyl transferase
MPTIEMIRPHGVTLKYMYFKNRTQAGKIIAKKLAPKYRYENCAVVALSDGAVVIGAEIAKELHCVLTMLLTEDIKLPGEHDSLAVVDQSGNFTYNSMFSAGQLEAFTGEYHSYIEQAKREQMHAINRLLGDGGLIRAELLRNHHVILVSDGLKNALSLDAAAQFLKPIKTEGTVVATPFASVPAVDRIHLLADDIVCLNVLENYMTTNHYYDDNKLPSHDKIIETIQNIVIQWK